jgi:hypothetical protein
MRIKFVLVLCVVALASCVASGQTFVAGHSSAIFGERCDVEVLFLSPPIASGYDAFLGPCAVTPVTLASSMVGWKGSVPLTLGLPLSGAVYNMADSFFDSFLGVDTQLQVLTMSKTKISTKKIGYMQLYGSYGSIAIYDYGFLINNPFGPMKKIQPQQKFQQYKPSGNTHLVKNQ